MAIQHSLRNAAYALLVSAALVPSVATSEPVAQNASPIPEMNRLGYLLGQWNGRDVSYASDGSGKVATDATIDVSVGWAPGLERRYLQLVKPEHMELYTFDARAKVIHMWSFSANRARTKEWIGGFEGNALVLHLQQEEVGTIAARIDMAPDGPYRVVDVVVGGSAAKAGIKTGDRIVAVNGVRVTPANQRTLLSSANRDLGTSLNLTVRQGKDEKNVSVPYQEKPQVKVVIAPTPQGLKFDYQILRNASWGTLGVTELKPVVSK